MLYIRVSVARKSFSVTHLKWDLVIVKSSFYCYEYQICRQHKKHWKCNPSNTIEISWGGRCRILSTWSGLLKKEFCINHRVRWSQRLLVAFFLMHFDCSTTSSSIRIVIHDGFVIELLLVPLYSCQSPIYQVWDEPFLFAIREGMPRRWCWMMVHKNKHCILAGSNFRQQQR